MFTRGRFLGGCVGPNFTQLFRKSRTIIGKGHRGHVPEYYEKYKLNKNDPSKLKC